MGQLGEDPRRDSADSGGAKFNPGSLSLAYRLNAGLYVLALVALALVIVEVRTSPPASREVRSLPRTTGAPATTVTTTSAAPLVLPEVVVPLPQETLAGGPTPPAGPAPAPAATAAPARSGGSTGSGAASGPTGPAVPTATGAPPVSAGAPATNPSPQPAAAPVSMGAAPGPATGQGTVEPLPGFEPAPLPPLPPLPTTAPATPAPGAAPVPVEPIIVAPRPPTIPDIEPGILPNR